MARRGTAETRVVRLARELIRIRWRGLEDLAVHDGHHPPRDTPETDHLAQEYCRVRGMLFGDDRVAEIRLLLQDGLAAYIHQGHQAEGQLLRRLFFAPSVSVPPQRPRDVLKEVKGEMDRAGEEFD